MAFFIVQYRKKGYTLADGLRPDPNCGKKTFTISGVDAGTDDIEVVRAMAASPEATPEGYELYSVIDRGAKPVVLERISATHQIGQKVRLVPTQAHIKKTSRELLRASLRRSWGSPPTANAVRSAIA